MDSAALNAWDEAIDHAREEFKTRPVCRITFHTIFDMFASRFFYLLFLIFCVRFLAMFLYQPRALIIFKALFLWKGKRKWICIRNIPRRLGIKREREA